MGVLEPFAKDLVLWKDGEGEWRCTDGICPHRLAPLARGRVTENGELMCRFHGWCFKAWSGTTLSQCLSFLSPWLGQCRTILFTPFGWGCFSKSFGIICMHRRTCRWPCVIIFWINTQFFRVCSLQGRWHVCESSNGSWGF